MGRNTAEKDIRSREVEIQSRKRNSRTQIIMERKKTEREIRVLHEKMKLAETSMHSMD